MLKKTITYTDFNGVERTEDYYFNLSESELMEAELGTSGGLYNMLQRVISSQDTPEIMKIFKKILLDAYGIKSEDGRRFIKSEEISKSFEQTEAYNKLFMELITDDEKAADFINSIVPKTISAEAKKQLTENKVVQDNQAKLIPIQKEETE